MRWRRRISLMKRDKGYSASLQEADWMLTVCDAGCWKSKPQDGLTWVNNLTLLLIRRFNKRKRLRRRQLILRRFARRCAAFELSKAQTNGFSRSGQAGVASWRICNNSVRRFSSSACTLSSGQYEQVPLLNRKGTNLFGILTRRFAKILEPTYVVS